MVRAFLFLQSAKEDEPKRTGEEERKTRIDNNGPKDLLVERKTNEDTVADSRQDDSREQADEPGRKE
jgi:hypothetical protein